MAIFYDLAETIQHVRITATPAHPVPLVPAVKLREELDTNAAMIAEYAPRILALDEEYVVEDLAELMRNCPLYRYRAETLLDDALTQLQTHADDASKERMAAAFGNRGLPNYNPVFSKKAEVAMINQLHHPSLGQIKSAELALIYWRFLHSLNEQEWPAFGFEQMIAMNPEHFYSQYDGVQIGTQIYIRFDQLLEQSRRADDQAPELSVEEYIAQGQAEAQSKTTLDMVEYLRHYMAADKIQSECCHAVYEIVSRISMMPEWLRADVKRMMGEEAKKQIYARKVLDIEAAHEYVEYTPFLAQALKRNADGKASLTLTAFIEAFQTGDPDYYHKAQNFAIGAQQRRLEAGMLKGVTTPAYSSAM